MFGLFWRGLGREGLRLSSLYPPRLKLSGSILRKVKSQSPVLFYNPQKH